MSSHERTQPTAVTLPDRYRARRHLASGGMAAVWCAEDLLLGRTVAVKVLSEHFTHDEIAVRRFKREARAAAQVSTHPHVVTIFDVGDVPADGGADGRAFIVMEYLAGGTLGDAIRVGAVRRQEAIRWVREAASAVDHAHARGIVHRDIKPGNFLLDRSRVLHVADFGIARMVSEDTITSAGELFGTAAYLSPEQALGREATGASDRYALAVTTFELLTGERPFLAQHFAAQARQHIETVPPLASERDRTLPPAVDEVLIRGMAKDPDERYGTAGAFVTALETALSELPITAPAAGRGRRRHQSARRPVAAGSALRARDGGPATAAVRSRAQATPPTGSHRAVAPMAPGDSHQRGSGRRDLRRLVALGALLVAIVGVAVFALAEVGAGTRHPATEAAAPRATATQAARVQHLLPSPHHTTRGQTAATTPTAPSPTPTAPPATPATPESTASAAQLQLTGHQEMLAGNYPVAIATLRQAVSAATPGSLTYAYGLYDLGRSLYLAGNPGGAVPILERRLKIPNQTAAVRVALNQALRASGQVPAQMTPSQAATTPTTSTSAPAPTGTGKPAPAGKAGQAAPGGNADPAGKAGKAGSAPPATDTPAAPGKAGAGAPGTAGAGAPGTAGAGAPGKAKHNRRGISGGAGLVPPHGHGASDEHAQFID